MKANEAPEKIYISNVPSELGGYKYITCDRDFPHAVEYIRTDAFIKKVEEYLSKHQCEYIDFDDFRKAMKGE